MALSELAEFIQQQIIKEEAALLGLHGLSSGSSRHKVISARMSRGAAHILQLLEKGKHEKAQALMETRTWGQEEPPEEGEWKRCHTMIPS